MRDNKRGAGHVETVISVVLFLTFVGIAFFLFSPIKATENTMKNSLNNLFDEIIKNNQIKIETYGVKINNLGTGENSIGIKINDINPEFEVSAIKSNGNRLSTYRNGDIISLEGIGTGDFVYVEFSENFPISNGGANSESVNAYEISSSTSELILSEKKIKDFISSYENSETYLILKRSLGVLDKNDFDFSFEFDGGGIIAPNEKSVKNYPKGIEIFSKSKRIKILGENGEKEFGELEVVIW